jgi:hypothetical protein
MFMLAWIFGGSHAKETQLKLKKENISTMLIDTIENSDYG